jgi:hypothetical protein
VRFSRLPTRNVLVTTGQLLPTVAKLMLFDLVPFFPIENIYSAAASSKLVRACSSMC